MSRHKRVLLWAGLLVALAGVGLAAVASYTATWVSEGERKCAQIHVGMTDVEAARILQQDFGVAFPVQLGRPGSLQLSFLDGGSIITLYLQMRDGIVSEVVFERDRPTIFAMIRRWIGL